MYAQVEKAGGAHDLNSKGLGSIPLYQAAKDHTGLSTKGGGGALRNSLGRYIVTVLEARTSLYKVHLRAVSCFAHRD